MTPGFDLFWRYAQSDVSSQGAMIRQDASYPLTDIERTIGNSYAIRFEIESQCATFFFQQATEHVHVFRGNPTADAQKPRDTFRLRGVGFCKSL
jgi:hypothetical protein